MTKNARREVFTWVYDASCANVTTSEGYSAKSWPRSLRKGGRRPASKCAKIRAMKEQLRDFSVGDQVTLNTYMPDFLPKGKQGIVVGIEGKTLWVDFGALLPGPAQLPWSNFTE